MKKITMIMMIFLAFVMSACGGSSKQNVEANTAPKAVEVDEKNTSTTTGVKSNADVLTLEKVLKAGKLVVGTTGDFPPFTATTIHDEVVGIDMDLTRLLALSMGVEFEVKTYPMKDLLVALEKGEVDLVAAGMTMTPERNLKASFVGPYFISGKSVIASAKNIAEIDSVNDLDKKTIEVVAVKGTTSESVAKVLLKEAHVKTVDTFDEAVQGVVDGTYTALVADHPYCAFMSYKYADKGISYPKEPFTFEPLGFAVRSGDAAFINYVENFIMRLNGSMVNEQIQTKWLSDMSWVKFLKESSNKKSAEELELEKKAALEAIENSEATTETTK